MGRTKRDKRYQDNGAPKRKRPRRCSSPSGLFGGMRCRGGFPWLIALRLPISFIS